MEPRKASPIAGFGALALVAAVLGPSLTQQTSTPNPQIISAPASPSAIEASRTIPDLDESGPWYGICAEFDTHDPLHAKNDAGVHDLGPGYELSAQPGNATTSDYGSSTKTGRNWLDHRTNV